VSVTDHVRAANAAFQESFPGPLTPSPRLAVAVVTCMDCRLDLPGALGLHIGDAHIIRNAGGVVSDDAIRSLVISQRLLGTKEIILIHHSDCGMVTFSDDAVKAQIKEDTGIRPSFSLEAFPDAADDVRQSIARIKASPFLPHRDDVRGFVYDVATGRLNEVHAERELSGASAGAVDGAAR
jgi:carbonic anhydrase